MTAAIACCTCGTEPLVRARFCLGCGPPVHDGDTRAEYCALDDSHGEAAPDSAKITTSCC
jgi:hypothetical protein